MYIATKSITINASAEKVWQALTDPDMVKQYLAGAKVHSDWKVGGEIVYKGEWEGKAFEDHGTILEIEPHKILKTTYFSAMSGLEDKLENYSVVTYHLTHEGQKTKLEVTQTNNHTKEAADKAEANWGMMLNTIKELLEK